MLGLDERRRDAVGAGSSHGASRYFVSGRTAIVLLVAVIAVVSLALPLREYLRQRSEINSAAEQQAEQQAEVDDLQRQVNQWQDEDFVRGQARERLHFLYPGEVGYKVLDPNHNDNVLAQHAPEATAPTGPWYDRLWKSVTTADRGTNPTP